MIQNGQRHLLLRGQECEFMMRSFRNYIWTMKLCLGKGGNEVSKEYTITDLYRQIGRTFRAHGVDKAVLLKARNSRKENSQENIIRTYPGMELEIAADGWFDKEKLLQECGKLWPGVEINILDLNEDENLGLVDEVMEDGILL